MRKLYSLSGALCFFIFGAISLNAQVTAPTGTRPAEVNNGTPPPTNSQAPATGSGSGSGSALEAAQKFNANKTATTTAAPGTATGAVNNTGTGKTNNKGKIPTMEEAILKGRTALSPANLSQLQWIPGAEKLAWVSNGKIMVMDMAAGKTDSLTVLTAINAALTGAKKKTLTQLPALTFKKDGVLAFQSEGAYFELAYGNTQPSNAPQNSIPDGAENADLHAATYNVAYTKDNALFVAVKGASAQVAKSEKEGIVYGKSVHRDEFGITKGTFWSASGNKLAFYRMDESMVTQYPIYELDSMPAQVRNIRYPFAGAKSHEVTVGVYDVATKKTIYLKTGTPAEQYLTNISWSPDDQYVFVAVLNREQNHMWFNQYEAATGKFVKTLFEETHEKYVEPLNPAVFIPNKNDQFIWQSQRDGFTQLYLYNTSGKLIRQLTAGKYPVIRILSFDDKGENCYYLAASSNGMDRKPYQVEIATGNAKPLLYDGGNHNVQVCNSGKYLVDNCTGIGMTRTIMVRNLKGGDAKTPVFTAPNPLDGYMVGTVRVDSIKANDGTWLNTRMILPSEMDANKKYPVIIYVYNGPHVQLVTNTWQAGAELWMHRMADLGYIVFTVDGHGSYNRGLSFENAVFRNLGMREVEDQMLGVKYLSSQPFVDTKRIGVFGWSFGGFMTTTMMTRNPGTFKCGVAGGAVISWDMYEIMYTERYMDTPKENPDGYNKSNLLNAVKNLKDRLLLIHGTDDDTVLWQHTLKFVKACVEARVPVEYFPYPGHAHNVLGKDRVHLFEKIEKYFVENL